MNKEEKIAFLKVKKEELAALKAVVPQDAVAIEAKEAEVAEAEKAVELA